MPGHADPGEKENLCARAFALSTPTARCTSERNLDWTQGYGERVVATPSAANVPAAFERPDDLATGHTVMGMGIVVAGIPLYFDCGNDAGLAVAGLNFPQSAHYATEPKADSINVAAYEFPFLIARNFSNLNEVRQALKATTVVAKPVNEYLPVANLHWLIGDATGSIVVECMADGLHIWENDADVLTNEPDFGWQRTNLRNYPSRSTTKTPPTARGEPWRSPRSDRAWACKAFPATIAALPASSRLPS